MPQNQSIRAKNQPEPRSQELIVVTNTQPNPLQTQDFSDMLGAQTDGRKQEEACTMLDKCKTKENLCQCVDWSGEDGTDIIDHLLHNYEFDRMVLDYSTLDKDDEIRLCQIGHCSKCGGQICIATVLHPCELLDDTLARIYAEASRRWRWYHEDEAFNEVFVQLFRGRDQQVARLWLDLERAKGAAQDASMED